MSISDECGGVPSPRPTLGGLCPLVLLSTWNHKMHGSHLCHVGSIHPTRHFASSWETGCTVSLVCVGVQAWNPEQFVSWGHTGLSQAPEGAEPASGQDLCRPHKGNCTTQTPVASRSSQPSPSGNRAPLSTLMLRTNVRHPWVSSPAGRLSPTPRVQAPGPGGWRFLHAWHGAGAQQELRELLMK